MKYIIFSDIHGSEFYANKINELVEKENPDKIILLGDLYYHGPRNSLPKEYGPMKVAEILNSLKDRIICIKGNCDAEVDEMISNFEFNTNVTIDISNKKFFFTHGHKFNIDNLPSEHVDVLVYGHFHTGFIKKKDGIICVNAGSISLPKNDTPNSFLIIEDNQIVLKDIDEKIIDKIEF
ncbi:MAG: phosphodiesterase [Clostridia bacterium]|nr:phosphodiesterase [Clostridia bacterium]